MEVAMRYRIEREANGPTHWCRSIQNTPSKTPS